MTNEISLVIWKEEVEALLRKRLQIEFECNQNRRGFKNLREVRIIPEIASGNTSSIQPLGTNNIIP